MHEGSLSRKTTFLCERGRERDPSMVGNWGHGVAQMEAHGYGFLSLKPKLKRLDYGVCGGLRILLYGSFPLKLEELSSQNTHTKKFYSKLTLFYR